MTLVMVLLTIAVVGGVSAVVAGVVSGGLSEPSSPIPARALPSGPLTGHDVAQLRFVQAFRGYRMDQVDAAMDSLAAEVDRLRRLVPGEGADPDPAGGPARPDAKFGSPTPNGALPERSEPAPVPAVATGAAGTTALATDAAPATEAPGEADPAGRPGAPGQPDAPGEAAVDAEAGERAVLPSDRPTGRD